MDQLKDEKKSLQDRLEAAEVATKETQSELSQVKASVANLELQLKHSQVLQLTMSSAC